MRDYLKFYIGGKWVEPAQPKTLEVINPATETVCGHISLGSAADVDARSRRTRGFKTFRRRAARSASGCSNGSSPNTRSAAKTSRRRSRRRWRPVGSRSAPRPHGRGAFHDRDPVLKTYKFEENRGTTVIAKEPIASAASSRPGTGRQPDRLQGRACACDRLHDRPQAFRDRAFSARSSPRSSTRRRPAGVFNLVNGDGQTAGAAISSHPVWTWCPSPARPAPASRSQRTPPLPSSACARSSRQEPEHRPRGRRHDGRRHRRRARGHDQFRSVLQRANAHARAAEDDGRGHRHRQGSGRGDDGRHPNGNAQIGPVVSEVQWKKVQA